MTVLPPFTETSMCPKCGHSVVTVVYSAGRSTGAEGCSYYCPERGSLREHLDRTCQRCHYQWPEATVEQE